MEPPDEFVGSISHEVFNDPVITSDGHTYERADILQWFRDGNVTSPMTGLTLQNKRLIKNIALSKLVSDWKDGAAAATPSTRGSRPEAVSSSEATEAAPDTRDYPVAELTVIVPQGGDTLEEALERCAGLTREDGFVRGTAVVLELDAGVHEVVGSYESWGRTYQKTMSVPCNNLSIVGQGDGETIVDGCFVVENSRKASFEGLTVKDSSWCGLVAYGAGTKMFLKNVTVEDCQGLGVCVAGGANLDATGCQFHQNGDCVVCVH